MSVLLAFIRHEVRTQLRSPRFIGVAAAYTLVSALPVVALALGARRSAYMMGGAMYSDMVDAVQPLLTAIAAAALAIDAISRERDEGSLGVVSLAPMSAAAFLLRRWAAILTILLPLTLVPRAAAYAIAAASIRPLPLLEPFLFGWLRLIVPVAIIISALALALGTITGRTVLALVATFLLFTFCVEILNNILAHSHRRFDGMGEMIRVERLDQIMYVARGWIRNVTSEAGFHHRAQLEAAAVRAAMPFAVAMALLGVASMYIRRSRRDLRPWRIPETHQLRSFLRMLNRLRDEYTPDATREWPDRLAIVTGVAIAIGTSAWLVHRYDAFAALARERYESEDENAPTTPLSVIATGAAIRGEVHDDGSVEAVATLDVRNTGSAAVRRLVFEVNPGLQVGGVRIGKRWKRVEMDLQPPLAPGADRRLPFAISGTPGDFEFALHGFGSFRDKYRKYWRATNSFDLDDLSRSQLWPHASSSLLSLTATDLMPVLRYSVWKGETREIIGSEIPVDVDLAVPAALRVADSCGTVATARIRSRCRIALTSYILEGGPMDALTMDGGLELIHLRPHRQLARMHAASLGGGVALAREAWPRLPLPDHLIFYERPAGPGEDWYRWYREEESLRSSGRLILVPELVFINMNPIDRNRIASGLMQEALRRRRRVVVDEERFFNTFYAAVARARFGQRKKSAVIPPTGAAPDVEPILTRPSEDRLPRVMADLEYRIGSERFFQGVEDFVFGGEKPGTARELLSAIEHRGGMDLDRLYSDYFLGNALPVLTFKDVRFTHSGNEWRVDGVLRNERTGEAFCPIVLRTAGGPLRQTLRVGAGESVAFTFVSRDQPRTLQLDPERVCYRYAQIGTVDSIDYRGEG